MTKNRIPNVGEQLHFFDDGKCGPSRHYICKVEEVIAFENTNRIIVGSEDGCQISLHDVILKEIKSHDWLYAKETDVVIKISCPQYDDNMLYCIRTRDGGFFSIDVQSSWQSGRLDVDGSIYNSVVNTHPTIAHLYNEKTY